MTEPNAQPQNTDQQPVIEGTPPRQQRSESARMSAALAKFGVSKEEPAAPAPAASAEPAETPVAEPEAPKAAPAQQAVTDSEDRLRKALSDLQKAEEAGLSTRRQMQELSKAKEEYEALLSEAKANPLAALKRLGLSYNEVTQKILKGELKAPDELDERLEPVKKLEDELKALKAEREQEKAQQAFTRDVQTVKEHATKNAERYPLAASLPWISEAVVNACYEGKTGDFDSILTKYEEAATKDAEALLSNPAAVKALLKNSKIRETLKAAGFSGSEQSRKAPVSSEGPRVLGTDAVSAPTTPKAPALKPQDRMKSAVSRLLGNT